MLEVVRGWPTIPAGWDFRDVAGVAVDSDDNVYLAVRTQPSHQVVIFSKGGEFIGSWGSGAFTRIHGITICDDHIYITDVGSHGVYRYTLDGHLELTLHAPSPPAMKLRTRKGTVTQPAAPAFFDGPTHVAVDSRHNMYVADGYGHSYIHRFRADGQYQFSWGGAGSDLGQFAIPHSIVAHHDALYVCDRENGRVQVFTGEGQLVAIWPDLPRVADLHIDRFGTAFLALLRSGEPADGSGNSVDGIGGAVDGSGNPVDGIGEPAGGSGNSVDGIGGPTGGTGGPVESQVRIRSCDGTVVQEIGGGDALSRGNFVSAHALCVDSEGSLYVGEATATNLTNARRTGADAPAYRRGMKTIQKFQLVDEPQSAYDAPRDIGRSPTATTTALTAAP